MNSILASYQMTQYFRVFDKMIVNNLEHELESNQIHCVRCDNFRSIYLIKLKKSKKKVATGWQ